MIRYKFVLLPKISKINKSTSLNVAKKPTWP